MVLLLVGLLFMVLLIFALSGQSTDVARPVPTPRISAPRKKGWFARWRVTPDTRIAEAWELIATAAHDSPNRVAVIRRSCDKGRLIMKDRPFDPASYELLVLLEKRVPELIESRLTKAADAQPHRAKLIIDDTLDLLERVAGYCERLMSHSGNEVEDADSLIAAHIRAQLGSDPLGRP